MKDMDFAVARRRMVKEQLTNRDIRDEHLLRVMAEIPRHLFVEPGLADQAYQDYPLQIGFGQTISQPYIVALMCQALALKPHHKVLEIGMGCGYQTVILARLAAHVYAIERIRGLAVKARRHLKNLGIKNVVLRVGDGTFGWSEAAPFDRIIVAAGAPAIPETLFEQLAEGGRLVIPVGQAEFQDLKVVEKISGKMRVASLGGCRFVSLIGQHGFKKKNQMGAPRVPRRSVVPFSVS